MPSYLHFTFQHLSRLPDRELVMLTGRYTRHADGDFLSQENQRLPLLGLPFSWLPPQGTLVDIWGRLIQGERRFLQVHDARPHEVFDGPPEMNAFPVVGSEMVFLARVMTIGNCQLALTADGWAYELVSDELDERPYCLQGHLWTLDPPTLQVIQAVPVLFPVSAAGRSSFDAPQG